MAAIIRHGPNGSYKSATTIQEHLLPALRAGRAVVTNIEGLYTLEVIQKRLKETFPDTARLFRISSQTEKGRYLWLRFFHWAPVGALIIIDEAQDIFTNDKSFKPEEYGRLPITAYDGKLTRQFLSYYDEKLTEFRPDIDESMVDDLNEQITDEKGNIIYPPTFKEAFNRHRKFDWDIVLVTPHIDNISKFIRGLCEIAYGHKSKDFIPFQYFQRRPRVLEHPPLESGLAAKKGDKVTMKKVSTDVFKVYKSTQTGKKKKSGVQTSPLNIYKVTFFLAFIGAVFIYWLFVWSPVGQDGKNAEEDNPVAVAQTQKVTTIGPRLPVDKAKSQADVSLTLPYGANRFYIAGVSKVYENGKLQNNLVSFTYKIGNDHYVIDSVELYLMGYQMIYQNPCLATLRKGEAYKEIYCQPRKIENLAASRERSLSDSEAKSSRLPKDS